MHKKNNTFQERELAKAKHSFNSSSLSFVSSNQLIPSQGNPGQITSANRTCCLLGREGVGLKQQSHRSVPVWCQLRLGDPGQGMEWASCAGTSEGALQCKVEGSESGRVRREDAREVCTYRGGLSLSRWCVPDSLLYPTLRPSIWAHSPVSSATYTVSSMDTVTISGEWGSYSWGNKCTSSNRGLAGAHHCPLSTVKEFLFPLPIPVPPTACARL